jgi:transcription initiation factor TFIID subunit 2
MDHFVREYGSFPYSTFKLCFVDDAPQQVQSSASITICSNNILYPPEIIDFLFPTTKLLTVALTSQWIGVNIVPKKWSDIWLTIGLSHYMAEIFLRKLMGNNEYRFRLKKSMERICEEDQGRRPLADSKMDAPISESMLAFISLKAPVVLFILNQRLTKPANSTGLQKVITKILLDAMSGDLVSLSTSTFLRKCEKHGHTRLEAFANQYIFGTGVPRFQITQRYNKKKMVIEVVLKQLPTNTRPPRKLRNELFVEDGLEHLDKEDPPPIQHLFTGPMTLRVYNDEGTPYEQTIEIREPVHRAEIQYNNTRRAKRKRKGATTNGDLPVPSDAVVLSLGDVLSTEKDVKEWRLVDWSVEDEERMQQDAFEWIRIDADLEWICEISLGIPEWMYAAQLQQDRDVIAQYESIKFFRELKESALISTIMLRTLMDERYYYGIRQEAAYVLAKV